MPFMTCLFRECIEDVGAGKLLNPPLSSLDLIKLKQRLIPLYINFVLLDNFSMNLQGIAALSDSHF